MRACSGPEGCSMRGRRAVAVCTLGVLVSTAAASTVPRGAAPPLVPSRPMAVTRNAIMILPDDSTREFRVGPATDPSTWPELPQIRTIVHLFRAYSIKDLDAYESLLTSDFK